MCTLAQTVYTGAPETLSYFHLYWWLQALASSDRLLREVTGSALAIASFSDRHRSQRREPQR